MERAGDAMKHIHGKLTVEKVDDTMYVLVVLQRTDSWLPGVTRLTLMFLFCREKIREQNALSEEIVNAITSNTLGEVVDDADLENELEQMQQEELDEQMLKTGSVPVSDAIQHMPAAANGESRSPDVSLQAYRASHANVPVGKSQGQGTCRGGGRRGSRAQEAAGRDGHVRCKRAIIGHHLVPTHLKFVKFVMCRILPDSSCTTHPRSHVCFGAHFFVPWLN